MWLVKGSWRRGREFTLARSDMDDNMSLLPYCIECIVTRHSIAVTKIRVVLLTCSREMATGSPHNTMSQ